MSKREMNDGLTVSTDEMLGALMRSGYLVEGRVVAELDRQGWIVEPNVVYPDGATGKLREIDILAHTASKVPDLGTLFAHVFIECINNPQPLVFMTPDRKEVVGRSHSIHYSGRPMWAPPTAQYDRTTEWIPTSHLRGDWDHHYQDGSLATQYCSFVPKGRTDQSSAERWMATHPDDTHTTFVKLVSAVAQERNDGVASLMDPRLGCGLLLNLYYSVLVLGGALFELPAKESDLRPVDSILYQTYFHNGDYETRHIVDVVTEPRLGLVLEAIRRDLHQFSRVLCEDAPQVRAGIDYFNKETQGITDRELFKKAALKQPDYSVPISKPVVPPRSPTH